MTHKSVKGWLWGQVISFPFKSIRGAVGGGEGDRVWNPLTTKQTFSCKFDSLL